jgi:hypothetical protein
VVTEAGAFVTTIRDLSATGLSFALPCPADVGTPLAIEMFAPGHTWRGEVVVARVEARVSRPGFDTWICGSRFEREQRDEDIERFQRWDAA